MMKFERLKSAFVLVVSYLFILLFVYAAVSKLLDFEAFQAQLSQSPLLSAYTGFISVIIPSLELLIALLLSFSKARQVGLLLFYGMMVMFSLYIYIILHYASFVPCSCGGILDDLGWREHLIFNLVFTILSGISCVLISNYFKKSLWRLTGISIVSFVFLISLQLHSEHILQKENPFIRRFIQGSVYKDTLVSLSLKTHYFAGFDDEFLYLANTQSPLHIIAFDSTFQKRVDYTIQLERTDFPFTHVQVRIVPPFFYFMDGSVPVIYRGLISDWKGKIVMHEGGFYFSKAEVLDTNRIAFRAQDAQTYEHVLGVMDFDSVPQMTYSRLLLEKQIDGIFDTDGMMRYDRYLNRFVYLYYYRNTYTVADNDLNLLHRGKTIDTIHHAQIKVYQNKKTGERQLISPQATVNQQIALLYPALFVHSKLTGLYEPKEMWKQSSIVDIYNLESSSYYSSLYIHHIDDFKLHDMQISHNSLYTLIGPYLVKYNFNSLLKSKIYTDQ